MFSGKSPNKTNIEEANKHLQLLYERVRELEEALERQAVDFSRRNEQMVSTMQRQLSDTTKRKEAHIGELKMSLDLSEQKRKKSEEQVQILRDEVSESNVSEIDSERWKLLVREKDVLISRLQRRCQKLEEFQGRLMKCRPSVEKLLVVMSCGEEETAPPGRQELTDGGCEAGCAHPDLPAISDKSGDGEGHHHHDGEKGITRSTKCKMSDTITSPPTHNVQNSHHTSCRNQPNRHITNSGNLNHKNLVNHNDPILAQESNSGINVVEDADDERSVTPTDLHDATDVDTSKKVDLKLLGVVKEEFVNGDTPHSKHCASGDVTSDSSSIRELARSFRSTTRHFSISEDEDDTDNNIIVQMQRQKELYL